MKKTRGLKKVWYKSGAIKEAFYTLNGKRDGEYTMFSEDGSVIASCSYVSGKIDGVFRGFDKNISRNFEYRNGLRHGQQFEYADGKLYRKYHYYKGKLSGEFSLYRSDEQLSMQCHMVDGLRDGKLVSYLGTKIRLIYNYRRGKLHGECVKYEKDTHMIGYFNEGMPIKKWKEVDKNGKTIKVYISSRLLANSMFQDLNWDIST